MKAISCYWLATIIFATFISLAISVDTEHPDGNMEVRRPKSREWLDQVKAEAQKHQTQHPTTLETRDIVSNTNTRGLFSHSSSSSSSDSSEGGLKKRLKRRGKMYKRARKHGRYLPYGYGGKQRYRKGYAGGYPGGYPSGYPGRYGSNYGSYGGNYGGVGGMLPPGIPAY